MWQFYYYYFLRFLDFFVPLVCFYNLRSDVAVGPIERPRLACRPKSAILMMRVSVAVSRFVTNEADGLNVPTE